MNNFENFLAVDWSGAKTPKASGVIAAAQASRKDNTLTLLPGQLSRQDVAKLIEFKLNEGKRCLVGIDCNFGYAESIGISQFGPDYTFRDLWREVEKSSDGLNDVYATGVWTPPEYSRAFWTSGKHQGFELEKRITETQCGVQGYGYPESPFKMIGPKQVGKGGLAGMRFVHHLKKLHGDQVAIWPFETDILDTAQIVITEIYPRLFLKMAGHGSGKVTDPRDLETILGFFGAGPLNLKLTASGAFSDHQSDALISGAGMRYLCGGGASLPEDIATPKKMSSQMAEREGWIFGVK